MSCLVVSWVTAVGRERMMKAYSTLAVWQTSEWAVVVAHLSQEAVGDAPGA